MRVLIINKFLYSNGGSETYIFKLGEALEQFSLITPSYPDLSFIYTSELYHKAGNAKSPNLLLPTERKTPQGACRSHSKF